MSTDIRIECSAVYTLQFLYNCLESRAEIINALYRMDSAIAPDLHSASAERVDLSSVLVAKVSHSSSTQNLYLNLIADDDVSCRRLYRRARKLAARATSRRRATASRGTDGLPALPLSLPVSLRQPSRLSAGLPRDSDDRLVKPRTKISSQDHPPGLNPSRSSAPRL